MKIHPRELWWCARSRWGVGAFRRKDQPSPPTRICYSESYNVQPRNMVGGVGELSFHLETRIGETHSLFIIRRLLFYVYPFAGSRRALTVSTVDGWRDSWEFHPPTLLPESGIRIIHPHTTFSEKRILYNIVLNLNITGSLYYKLISSSGKGSLHRIGQTKNSPINSTATQLIPRII